MASDEVKVWVESWPKEPAALEHHFSEEPCPVSISFTEKPAHVVVATDPKRPLDVDMNMKVSAKEAIPICIKLCEPICAKSDYMIGINIFDNPFAAINIRGMTKIYNCREKPESEPPKRRVCVGFDKLKESTLFGEPFVQEGLTFSPLGEELRTATFGEPAGRIKLAFPGSGLRVDFPQPVKDLLLTINNYGSPDLMITAFAGSAVLAQFSVTIDGEVKNVAVNETGITALTITGGGDEAGLVEICYLLAMVQQLTTLRTL